MGLCRFSVGVSLINALLFSVNALTTKCNCNENVCKVVFKFPLNYQTSKHLCEKMGGQLMTVKSKAVSDDVGDLLKDMPADYWIGLRLPDGHCTNDTSPLKGYIWTTGWQSTEFTNWKSNDVLCSSTCVSISVDLKWTEKLCVEQSDGFLCDNVPEYECSSFDDPGYSKVIHHHDGCLSGICEHNCDAVDDQYFRCSCSTGYVIDKEKQGGCELDCSARCHAQCERSGDSCDCPKGYILDKVNEDFYCVEINECEQANCDHYCFNTLGGFECSCRDGFRLVGVDRCVETTELNTERTPGTVFIVPSLNYTMGQVAAVAPGKVIGIMAFILVGLAAVVFFLRYWKQKKDKPSINSTGDDDDTKQVIAEEPCQQLC